MYFQVEGRPYGQAVERSDVGEYPRKGAFPVTVGTADGQRAGRCAGRDGQRGSHSSVQSGTGRADPPGGCQEGCEQALKRLQTEYGGREPFSQSLCDGSRGSPWPGARATGRGGPGNVSSSGWP